MKYTLTVACIFFKSVWQAVSLHSALTALLLAPLAVLHAAESQDIEWNTPQFIANSRQPAEGMMYPGEIRLAGPRIVRAGEPLRCG